jgi:hypothetical protein
MSHLAITFCFCFVFAFFGLFYRCQKKWDIRDRSVNVLGDVSGSGAIKHILDVESNNVSPSVLIADYSGTLNGRSTEWVWTM